jgi:hypothetical protein
VWDPCGCSSMAERQLPKLIVRVRFPSPAPVRFEHVTAYSAASPGSASFEVPILCAISVLEDSRVRHHEQRQPRARVQWPRALGLMAGLTLR